MYIYDEELIYKLNIKIYGVGHLPMYISPSYIFYSKQVDRVNIYIKKDKLN